MKEPRPQRVSDEEMDRRAKEIDSKGLGNVDFSTTKPRKINPGWFNRKGKSGHHAFRPTGPSEQINKNPALKFGRRDIGPESIEKLQKEEKVLSLMEKELGSGFKRRRRLEWIRNVLGLD